MKKSLTTLLLLCVILLASFSGNNGSVIRPNKNDCIELNLKGRIHAICECLFDADVKSDKVFIKGETPQRVDSTWFDDKGNKLDEKIYSATGQVLTEWSYRYDAKESLLELAYIVKGKQRQRDTYKYDSLDRVLEWVRYKGNDSLYEKDTYKYDDQGNADEQDVEEHYPLKQNIKKFYQYDGKGNRLSESEYKPGGGDEIVHTWKYDGSGKMYEEDDYATTTGRVRTKIMFKYNDRGDMTERSVVLPDGSVSSKEIYTYNAKGYKAVVDNYNNMGKLYHYYTYKYDDRGNVREEKEFKVFSDEVPQMENADTYELDYDKKGNWVKKTDLKIDGTVTVAQREIMYY